MAVELSGTAAGTASLTATLNRDAALYASPSGQASVTAKLNRDAALTGSPAGTANAYGHVYAVPYYSSRPVFDQEIDWASEPSGRYRYDLKELDIGWLSPRYERIQKSTVQGFDVKVLLEDEGKLDDFEAFVDLLSGRLQGFWFPSPYSEIKIDSGVNSTQFKIEHQGWEAFWGDHPSQHLIFEKDDQRLFAKVTAVSDNYDGTETATIDQAHTIDETWTARKLLYARMASDEEEAEFLADNVQERRLRIVELPEEYAQAETGQRPVYLYHFWIYIPATGEQVDYYFTSLNVDIESNGQTYTSQPIEHAGHRDTVTGEDTNLQVRAVYDSWNPLAQFLPFSMPAPLWMEAIETTYGSPDTTTKLFTGRVQKVDLEGRSIRAEVANIIDALGRRFPKMMIQPRCNWFLFSTPCGVNSDNYKAEVTLTTVIGTRIDVDAQSPVNPDGDDNYSGAEANYFTFGYMVTGSGSETEIRSIIKSSEEWSGEMGLWINTPLRFATQGQAATIFAGCDKAGTTCDNKFDNFKRWGGHVVAPRNPTIEAMENERASGNKK